MQIELQEIIEGEEIENTHEKRMLEIDKTNVWNVNKRESMEIEMETGFEKLLLSVAEFSNEPVEKMSTFRFYALQELIKDRNKANSNGRSDNKL